MKITKILLASAILFSITNANAAICPSAGCDANWLNVPGDFSQPVNYFSMYLLGVEFNVDSPDGGVNGATTSIGGGVLNTSGKQIQFAASQFDHIGQGQGTSVLNAMFNHYEIGSSVDFLGGALSIFLDGQATGTLADNSNSTQDQWTLNTHLYADWNGIERIDLGVMPLSTAGSYSYVTCGESSCIGTEGITIDQTITTTGSSMNYHNGLAYMVGQGIIVDQLKGSASH